MHSRAVLVALIWTSLAITPGLADWNVKDFGAAGNGAADDTAAFQKALEEAGKAGGGVVNVPAGSYRINGNLSIPRSVTLQGTYSVPPLVRGRGAADMRGSALLAYAGRGRETGEAFVRLAGDSACIKGLIISYPEWDQKDVPPIPYPPCIFSQDTENVGVIDCLLLNPYDAIKFVRAHRHQIRNVHGYPIHRGIFVDQCYDIGQILNVHFWPFGVAYNPEDPYCKWINTNGVAFEFARTDWHYVTNTFCFGYGIGYRFSEYANGGCNGNFSGNGADCCQRAVVVEQAQGPGLLITNGEFVGRWGSKDSVTLEIGEKVTGKVTLLNCSFWGPIDRCVWVRGKEAQFKAIGCNFCNWDVSETGAPAVQLDAGKAILQANSFDDGYLHVRIGQEVRSAIVSANQAAWGLNVENLAGKRALVFGNELPSTGVSASARSHYRILVGAGGDRRYLSRWHGAEQVAGGKWRTRRWSRSISEIKLPVIPGRSYADNA